MNVGVPVVPLPSGGSSSIFPTRLHSLPVPAQSICVLIAEVQLPSHTPFLWPIRVCSPIVGFPLAVLRMVAVEIASSLLPAGLDTGFSLLHPINAQRRPTAMMRVGLGCLFMGIGFYFPLWYCLAIMDVKPKV